ncbi:MAG: hypothetical protein NTX25_01740 [Proteobacteria bacterium]|nr:hypothetical protein [Pseudomonadota bacterium]
MQAEKTVKVAGIHLAGPSSSKTTLVIMTGQLGEGNLKITAVLDRMGSLHRLFSDDRLFELLRNEHPDRVMIDSPLTVPPCVACTRPSCPGVDACEDIAVAYMQKLAESAAAKRRKRPMNPQTQRIWDLKEWFTWHPSLQEPTYSANKAPLVVMAMTLQRRLNSLSRPIILEETSVPHAVSCFVEQLGLLSELAYQYRAFEIGYERRYDFLQALVKHGQLCPDRIHEAASSLESFSATVSALVAALHMQGLCKVTDSDFFRQQGWVFLPEIACKWPGMAIAKDY